jgi:multicomponent Na+:H+ antiporter subunit F
LCLYRISRGPTPADRVVGIDILGIIVVNFSAIVSYITRTDFYLNISLSWALLSFIGTIAVSKFLEGKGFDE